MSTRLCLVDLIHNPSAIDSDSSEDMPLKNFLDEFEKPTCRIQDKNPIFVETTVGAAGESNFGAYGCMRKEKEWKRTLACKLLEERHNVVDGDEGMDMLWETYEVESMKEKEKCNKIKSRVDLFGESDEDGERGVQLCCLQALKLSTGKMNLGMRRSSLVKFSKALKGIGWLHHVIKNAKNR